jgi:hypothetical protein
VGGLDLVDIVDASGHSGARHVRVGAVIPDGRSMILSGLAGGERVVVHGGAVHE